MFPKIPAESGVYIFRSKKQPLYVGKAGNLRARIRAYFRTGNDMRIQQMIAQAVKINWQITASEIEALILESKLIKKYQPEFNIALRDDKQYGYVVITVEEFPKICVSHQPLTQQPAADSRLPAGEKPAQQEARNRKLAAMTLGPFTDVGALRTTMRLLRKIFPYCTCKQKHAVYCLNYHIGNCPGFCCLKTPKAPNLKTQKLEYRQNIKAIEEILYDRRVWVIKMIERKMHHAAQKENFEQAIYLRNKLAKLKKTFENARILSNKAEYFVSDNYKNKDSLLKLTQRELGLATLPQRIEAYDVSEIHGQFRTGAMVVFTNGKPDTRQYRKFKIHRNKKQGDIFALKEIIQRRLSHRQWPYPDLAIIDGGKAQLSVAKKLFPSLVTVAALTKNYRHVPIKLLVSHQTKYRWLSSLPQSVRNLLIFIDAEAHRSAIGFYRKLHRKSILN